MQELPHKEFYKLSEVCQYTDTQPYVLRFWESEFPQLRPRKGASGQPLYRRADIELVRRIKELLYEEEQTLDAARQRLADELSRGPVSAPKPRAVAPTPRAVAAAPPAARPPESPVAAAEERDLDVVPRGRYQDAIDEVEHLRLELREAEKALRRAEGAAAEAGEAAARERERSEKAVAYLERLREILS